MALVVKDRVKVTTTTTGTGTFTLNGAAAGFQDFTVIGDGNQTYYAATFGSDWEVGIGTFDLTTDTLTRDTILESSNAGAAVDFPAGAKDVFVVYPAERAVFTDVAQTLTNKTISGADNTLANIGNSSLTNSSVTVNGTSIALGASGTVTAANPQALTIGTGLSGTSYDGSAAVTVAIDSTVATLTGTQTLTGKTISFADNTLTGVAGVTATQTLTNKTAEKLILNDGYTEEVFAITDGSTVNLDPNNGSIQTWTLGANRTPGQANWAAGQSITLLVDDGSAHTITWTTLAVVWKTDGGTAPTLELTGFTVIVLWKVGTTIYGARVGDA
jgi:hypothetical protein